MRKTARDEGVEYAGVEVAAGATGSADWADGAASALDFTAERPRGAGKTHRRRPWCIEMDAPAWAWEAGRLNDVGVRGKDNAKAITHAQSLLFGDDPLSRNDLADTLQYRSVFQFRTFSVQ